MPMIGNHMHLHRVFAEAAFGAHSARQSSWDAWYRVETRIEQTQMFSAKEMDWQNTVAIALSRFLDDLFSFLFFRVGLVISNLKIQFLENTTISVSFVTIHHGETFNRKQRLL